LRGNSRRYFAAVRSDLSCHRDYGHEFTRSPEYGVGAKPSTCLSSAAAQGATRSWARLAWGPGYVKTLRGINAPGILSPVVTRRARKRKISSSARHDDQIRFRFRTAWVEFRQCYAHPKNHLAGAPSAPSSAPVTPPDTSKHTVQNAGEALAGSLSASAPPRRLIASSADPAPHVGTQPARHVRHWLGEGVGRPPEAHPQEHSREAPPPQP
jgi:hypothetical protein